MELFKIGNVGPKLSNLSNWILIQERGNIIVKIYQENGIKPLFYKLKNDIYIYNNNKYIHMCVYIYIFFLGGAHWWRASKVVSTWLENNEMAWQLYTRGGDEGIVWGVKGPWGSCGGVSGVERRTWEAVWRAKRISKYIRYVSWTKLITE